MTIQGIFFTSGQGTTATETAHEAEGNPLFFEPEETMPSQDPSPFNGEGDDADDDVTIIGIDNNDVEQGERMQRALALAWIQQNIPATEERRRNMLLRELQRTQRTNFIHFTLLCLIPTTLLIIVMTTVFGEDEDCSSIATTCVTEAGNFMNAYTTSCICDAVDVKEG
jgi:hypothetical protein